MKHPCARAIPFQALVVIGALSACRTVTNSPAADEPTQPVAVRQGVCAAAEVPERAPGKALDASLRPQVGQYSVVGEVATQGPQPFDGDLTIFEAVTRAQPRMSSANLGHVKLIRADPRDPFECTIDLLHIMETGDTTQNVHVQDRDVIYVPAAEPVVPKR